MGKENKMSASSTSAKAIKPKAKKPAAAKSGNPTSSVMVKAAIEGLKERKGFSLVAIKKYIATNYKIDPSKHSHFIKKALTSGVEKKTIVQTKGTGASGSFKLAKVEVKKPVKKAVKAKTPEKPASKANKKTKAKPSAAKKATPKKKVEKSKSSKATAKTKKPAPKKAAPAKNRQRKLPQRRNRILLLTIRALFRAMKCSTTYVTIEK